MWLLESRILQLIENAYKSGYTPSAEQLTNFQAIHGGENSGNGGRILNIVGANAEIVVQGVITETPDFMAMFFGGGNTLYSEIVSAIAMAEQDDSITNVNFLYATPGGQLGGLFDTIAAMQAMKKPTTATVSEASSAGFALAAQQDKIIAKNEASIVGSIGVATSAKIDPNTVDISGSKSPKKRPDASTAEGQAIIREGLNPIEDLFIDAVAAGRNTTAQDVVNNFGQGSILIAKDALNRGMIDSIASTSNNTPNHNANSGIIDVETTSMDLNKLKAEHPGLFAEVVQIGTDGERDRVTAHLIMGETSGDMKTAIKAIGDGSIMTQALQATYMTAGMNRKDLKDRQDDDAGASAGDTASLDDNQGSAADTVAGMVEASLGNSIEV